MNRCRTLIVRLRADENGTALVEFALIGPVLMVMLLGMIAYGGYFWMSNTVQQVANDAARAAVAGLTATERSSLAQTAIANSISPDSFMVASAAAVTITGTSDTMKVRVAYDASGSPFYALAGLLPLPNSTITREAAIRLGGY